MPSIVHSNPALLSGLALVSQSFTEQPSGLVLVSMEFAGRASKTLSLDKLFYPDAPPPIWPSSVNRDSLLTRRLYMVDRGVEQENGLVRVTANYAGGLARDSERIFRTQTFENEVEVSETSEPFSFTFYDPENPLAPPVTTGTYTNSYFYVYKPTNNSFTFVEIGGQTTAVVAPPPITELYSLLLFRGLIFAPRPDKGWAAFGPIETPREYFVDLIESKGIKEDRKSSYITPTVQEVTVSYSIE
jgi:hypothetical protein